MGGLPIHQPEPSQAYMSNQSLHHEMVRSVSSSLHSVLAFHRVSKANTLTTFPVVFSPKNQIKGEEEEGEEEEEEGEGKEGGRGMEGGGRAL